MRTWKAMVDLGLTLTQDEIDKNPDRFAGAFADPKNPTDEEVEDYFDRELEDLANSKAGRQRLGEADFRVEKTEKMVSVHQGGKVVIKDLTYERVHGFLAPHYYRAEQAVEDAKELTEEPVIRKQGEFKDGTVLATLDRSGSKFAVVGPDGVLRSVFSVYDPESTIYKDKHDVFMITAHETLHEVSSDGTYEVDHTR